MNLAVYKHKYSHDPLVNSILNDTSYSDTRKVIKIKLLENEHKISDSNVELHNKFQILEDKMQEFVDFAALQNDPEPASELESELESEQETDSGPTPLQLEYVDSKKQLHHLQSILERRHFDVKQIIHDVCNQFDTQKLYFSEHKDFNNPDHVQYMLDINKRIIHTFINKL